MKKFFNKFKQKFIKEVKKKFLFFFYKPILTLSYFSFKIPYFNEKSIFKKPIRFIFKILKKYITKDLIFFLEKKFVFFTNRFFKKLFFYIEKLYNIIFVKIDNFSKVIKKISAKKKKPTIFSYKKNTQQKKLLEKINFIKKPIFNLKHKTQFSFLRKNKFFYKSQNVRVRQICQNTVFFCISLLTLFLILSSGKLYFFEK